MGSRGRAVRRSASLESDGLRARCRLTIAKTSKEMTRKTTRAVWTPSGHRLGNACAQSPGARSGPRRSAPGRFACGRRNLMEALAHQSPDPGLPDGRVTDALSEERSRAWSLLEHRARVVGMCVVLSSNAGWVRRRQRRLDSGDRVLPACPAGRLEPGPAAHARGLRLIPIPSIRQTRTAPSLTQPTRMPLFAMVRVPCSHRNEIGRPPIACRWSTKHTMKRGEVALSH